VTKTSQEAGIRFPVFLTRTVYDAYLTVPPDVDGQDEAGRLWDIVNLLKFAIRSKGSNHSFDRIELPNIALCCQKSFSQKPSRKRGAVLLFLIR